MGWNWAAFSLGGLWRFFHRVDLPHNMNAFEFAARANLLAWQGRAWPSTETFKRTQRAWSIMGFLVWFIGLGIGSYLTLSPVFTFHSDTRVLVAFLFPLIIVSAVMVFVQRFMHTRTSSTPNRPSGMYRGMIIFGFIFLAAITCAAIIAYTR